MKSAASTRCSTWSFIFTALTFSKCLIALVAANCFVPNGTERNFNGAWGDLAIGWEDGVETYSHDYCSDVSFNTESGMCCRSNSDTCLPNGLCQQANSDVLWRESCTESDWDSPWCLKLCVDGDDGKTDVQVLQCDDGSFCCHRDQDATDCCNLHQGKFIINGTTGYSVIDNPKASGSAAFTTLQETTSSASTSASSSASSSTSSTILSTPRSNPVMSTLSPSSAATPPPPKSSSSTNSGAIAGGVVGGVAAFSIILVGSWCYRRRQRRKMAYTGPLPREYESPTSIPPMIKTGGGMHEVEGSLDRQKELDGNEKYEIASENRKSQLPEMA